jgi:non-ribosomal peptide synthetase component F
MSVFSATPGAAGTDMLPDKVFRSELNPVDFLYRAAYVYPDKAAVVEGERRYSYRQLAERSWRLANALRSAGLAKGDRVATLLFKTLFHGAPLGILLQIQYVGTRNLKDYGPWRRSCRGP